MKRGDRMCWRRTLWCINSEAYNATKLNKEKSNNKEKEIKVLNKYLRFLVVLRENERILAALSFERSNKR